MSRSSIAYLTDGVKDIALWLGCHLSHVCRAEVFSAGDGAATSSGGGGADMKHVIPSPAL